MAKDPRRFVSLTLPPEQADWIEGRFPDAANKGEAIKAVLAEAMAAPENGGKPVATDTAQPTVLPSKEIENLSRMVAVAVATLELLVQKYMADHPPKAETRTFAEAMSARWRDFETDRESHLSKVRNNAP